MNPAPPVTRTRIARRGYQRARRAHLTSFPNGVVSDCGPLGCRRCSGRDPAAAVIRRRSTAWRRRRNARLLQQPHGGRRSLCRPCRRRAPPLAHPWRRRPTAVVAERSISRLSPPRDVRRDHPLDSQRGWARHTAPRPRRRRRDVGAGREGARVLPRGPHLGRAGGWFRPPRVDDAARGSTGRKTRVVAGRLASCAHPAV